MTESAIGASPPVTVARKPSPLFDGAMLPRLIAGVAILLAWEFVVRGLAPAYVAKPSTVIVVVSVRFLTSSSRWAMYVISVPTS